MVLIMENEKSLQKKYIFSAGLVLKKKIYFFSEKENTLMETKIDEWKIRYSEMFLDCNIESIEQTDSLRSIGKKIFKLSLNGKYIEEFLLQGDGKYKKFEIQKSGKAWGNFVAFEVKDEFLYVFLKWKREVIKINSVTYKIEKIFLNNCQNKFICFSTAYRENNRMWLFESENKRVEIFNFDTNMSIICALPKEIKGCISVGYISGKFYILTSDNQIYIWEKEKNRCVLFWKGKDCYKDNKYFSDMLIVQQKIILLPLLGSDIVIIDSIRNREVIYDNYPKDFHYYDIKWSKYINRFDDINYYYYPMRMSNYLMMVSKYDGEILWKKLNVPSKEERWRFWKAQNDRYPQIIDDDISEVSYFLDLKKEMEVRNKKKIGSIIWGNISK